MKAPPIVREEAWVSVSGLNKSFASSRVLQDIDLSLFPGEVVALLGANGAVNPRW
ncbi:ABC transporter protein, ATP binding component [Pseudomonas savastanoi pv. glycinea str. race 4]|uniref:ABC transporter protein, ATP binding component n=1 Tax=Pseudomonas savastanoi pv. glycinea str. race 4 TaxID=875330 RepID=F3CE30_PSESG|nr:ABC transporter protein, ATP binding component [Pseudomonas savastanoi pv. glycinea str. race 4]